MYDKINKTKVDSIIPKTLADDILKSAKKNGRSKSQEICYILTKYFAHDIKERGNTDVHNMEGTKSI